MAVFSWSIITKRNFMGSHSILYGHNIEGNMMFANLNRYEQPEFLEKMFGN